MNLKCEILIIVAINITDSNIIRLFLGLECDSIDIWLMISMQKLKFWKRRGMLLNARKTHLKQQSINSI